MAARFLPRVTIPRGQGIYRVDVQTGELNPVVQEKHRGDIQRFDAAVWASDGKAIFYRWSNNVEPPGQVDKILTRTLKSGSEKELLGAVWPSLIFGSLAVSPDGRWLAFISGIDTPEHGPASMALRVMPAGGGEPRELLHVQAPDVISQLAWTPDGRQLLFGRIRTSSPGSQSQKIELLGISAEGGEPQNLGLAMEGRSLDGLSVHPDGRRIAFTVEQPSRSELWVMEDFLPALKTAKSGK